jgi:copper homeostasis protein
MGLEICVDSVASAFAAEAGGAERIELCSALIEGGLTPGPGLLRAVCSQLRIGVHVMIRPRGGDFLYTAEELTVMRYDIEEAARWGAAGVVLGLLTAAGEVDVARTRELVNLARPMKVTFHRAIDLTRDVQQSLGAVIETGAAFVLTSGGEQTVIQGQGQIRRMVEAANGQIRVMAGGGVRPDNVEGLIAATGVSDIHAALRTAIPSQMAFRTQKVQLGDAGSDSYDRTEVRVEDVKILRQAMDRCVSTRAKSQI